MTDDDEDDEDDVIGVSDNEAELVWGPSCPLLANIDACPNLRKNILQTCKSICFITQNHETSNLSFKKNFYTEKAIFTGKKM